MEQGIYRGTTPSITLNIAGVDLSATVADHMEAQDVKIGKWKCIQTQDGTHLTLVWAG